MQYPHQVTGTFFLLKNQAFTFPPPCSGQLVSTTSIHPSLSLPLLPASQPCQRLQQVTWYMPWSRHFHALLSYACFSVCHGTFPFIILYPYSLAHVLLAAGTFQWWINNPHLLSYISHWFPWHHSPSLSNPMAFSIGSELFKECLSWGLGDSHSPGRKPWGRSKATTLEQFCNSVSV